MRRAAHALCYVYAVGTKHSTACQMKIVPFQNLLYTIFILYVHLLLDLYYFFFFNVQESENVYKYIILIFLHRTEYATLSRDYARSTNLNVSFEL